MLLSFLYGLIGIILLTAFCLIGAFAVPQIAYWTMTPNAQKLLEEYGISRKFNLKGKISFAILTAVICALYLITIISAGKQGVNSGMNFWQLSIRFVIFFWMIFFRCCCSRLVDVHENKDIRHTPETKNR